MKKGELTLKQACGILTTILLMLFVGCGYWKLNSQIVLLGCTLLTAFFAKSKGYSAAEIEKMAVEGIRTVAAALLINICIGMLISVWISAGTFSFFIQLCLQVLDPRFFLVESFLFCCIFSALVGSCWICAGTIGLALFYISQMLPINHYLLIGAIIGGSRFGACISPISDSANISRLLSGVKNIYQHTYSALQVVLPGALMTGIIYLGLDLLGGKNRGLLEYSNLIQNLNEMFRGGVMVLLPAVVLCFMIYRKKLAIVCLLSSIGTGAVITVLLQKKTVFSVADILFYGYGGYIEPENTLLSTLFDRGGIISMSSVLFTLIIGMSMGGILNRLEVLKKIVDELTLRVKSPRMIVFLSMMLAVLGYGATGDSQPSKVLVSSAFSGAYDREGIGRGVLSRTLEMSAFGEGMFPWTVGAMYFSTLFGASASQYWYYVFFYYFVMLANILHISERTFRTGYCAD